jgi:hypothetical protein
MILQVAVLQSHLEFFHSEGSTRSAPSQKIVKSKTGWENRFECTYLNLRWFLMLLVGGQVGGQVCRWFVKIISRIHMFWHSSNMHEGYVRIIFNIKKKNPFHSLKNTIFFYIKNVNLFYEILNVPDIDSMQCQIKRSKLENSWNKEITPYFWTSA